MKETRLLRGFSKVASCGLLCLLCFVCYWNSLPGGLVHDDIFAIRDNKDVRPDTPIFELLLHDFWGKPMSDPTSHKSYRPLTVLTFRLNYALHGLSSWGYHFVNVLLHMICSLLVWSLCDIVVFPGYPFLSLQTALLFAVHPIHTEAVSGVVGRADILSCIWFIVCFLLYHSSIKSQVFSMLWLLKISLCILTGCFAMLCKEQGITSFGLCVLYDAALAMQSCFRKVFSWWWPSVIRVLSVTVATILLLAVRIWLLNGMLPRFSSQDNPASFSDSLMTRFLTYSYLYYFNSKLLLFPSTLCYDWQMGSIPLVESLFDSRNICTLLFFLYMLGLLWSIVSIIRSNGDYSMAVCVGATISVVSFLPASNIFLRVGFVVAERVLYIPSIGTCILITYGLHILSGYISKQKLSHGFKTLAGTLFLFILISFALKTIHRNPVWYSRESLFRSGVDTLPDSNAKIHYNYANFLKDTGMTNEAITYYKKALKLSPNHSSAHNNLATLLSGVEAEDHFKKAIINNPEHFKAYFNLANNQLDSNLEKEAEFYYRESIRINPEYTDAILKLSSLLSKQQRHNESEDLIDQALELNSDNPDTLANIAVLLISFGKPIKAIDVYKAALKLNPFHSNAIIGLARAYRMLQENEKAESLYKMSLSIEPKLEVYKSLGAMYYNTGRVSDSYVMLKEALQMDPNDRDALCTYAQVARNLVKIKVLEDLVVKFPGLYCVNFHLAGTLAQHHSYLEKALLYSSTTVDLAVTSKEIYEAFTLRAMILKDLKRFSEAVQDYEHAVVMYPQEVSSLINLGAIFHLMGNYTMAELYYIKAQTIDPNNQLIHSNLNKLKKRKHSN